MKVSGCVIGILALFFLIQSHSQASNLRFLDTQKRESGKNQALKLVPVKFGHGKFFPRASQLGFGGASHSFSNMDFKKHANSDNLKDQQFGFGNQAGNNVNNPNQFSFQDFFKGRKRTKKIEQVELASSEVQSNNNFENFIKNPGFHKSFSAANDNPENRKTFNQQLNSKINVQGTLNIVDKATINVVNQGRGGPFENFDFNQKNQTALEDAPVQAHEFKYQYHRQNQFDSGRSRPIIAI